MKKIVNTKKAAALPKGAKVEIEAIAYIEKQA